MIVAVVAEVAVLRQLPGTHAPLNDFLANCCKMSRFVNEISWLQFFFIKSLLNEMQLAQLIYSCFVYWRQIERR